MSKSSNRTRLPVLLARTAPLSLALALFACSEKERTSGPGAASAFKDSAPQPSPPGPSGATAPTATAPAATAPPTPEQLWAKMGCRACHGPGSAYAPVIAQARSKPVEDIARWILNPEQVRPGSLMPSYARRLSQEEALALAGWIKAGNPAPSAP